MFAGLMVLCLCVLMRFVVYFSALDCFGSVICYMAFLGAFCGLYLFFFFTFLLFLFRHCCFRAGLVLSLRGLLW